jgi:hypothetical protein
VLVVVQTHFFESDRHGEPKICPEFRSGQPRGIRPGSPPAPISTAVAHLPYARPVATNDSSPEPPLVKIANSRKCLLGVKNCTLTVDHRLFQQHRPIRDFPSYYRRSGRTFPPERELALRRAAFTLVASSSPTKGFLIIRASPISASTP